MGNKTLGIKYSANINDAPVSDLLRKTSNKTENHLRFFYYSSSQNFLDIGKSRGAYIIFYQGVPIDHGSHVSGTFSQPNTYSEYNAACNAGMDLAHFRMLIHELLNKDPDIVPE